MYSELDRMDMLNYLSQKYVIIEEVIEKAILNSVFNESSYSICWLLIYNSLKCLYQKNQALNLRLVNFDEQEEDFWGIFHLDDIPNFIILFGNIFLTLIFTHIIDFSFFGKYFVEDLPNHNSRIKFVCQLSIYPIYWLIFCFMGVVLFNVLWNHHRTLVRKMNNIFLISILHFLQSFIAQCVLVLFLDARLTLRYIPALVFLFILGRGTLLMRGRHYWIIGNGISVRPALLAIIYIIYQKLTNQLQPTHHFHVS